MAQAGELETRSDAERYGKAKYWQKQLDLSDKDHEDFIKRGRKVIERYRAESAGGKTTRYGKKSYNILYSNSEVEEAALFARMAKPDIRRRFSDPDPRGRIIAEIIERAIIYTDDTNDAERSYRAAIKDYILPGRGVVRVCYEAEVKGPQSEGQLEGEQQDADKIALDDGDLTPPSVDESMEYIARQDLYDEHILWEDFRHEPAPSWDKTTWVSFRHYMSRDNLHKNFDEALGEEEVDKIPLNWAPDADKKTKVEDAYKKAEVWEVWDRDTKTRSWIVKGYDKVLRTDPDPYGLEFFFPMAEPIQAVTTNETLIPMPEFLLYQDQADALDEIETRLDRLTRALKRRGIYNASIKELKRLALANDNEFIPAEKWSEFAQGGGLKGNYDVEDISVIAGVLQELQAQREQRIQTIYEIIGIADIMRGISNPNETLGAQQLKAQFGGTRLKRRQDEVQRFIRDTMRIKAEIIAEHFEPQRLAEMSGYQLAPEQPMDPQTGQPITPDNTITPEIMQIIRQDRLRSYRIDVETDSTIYEDAESEKQSRVELVTAMTQFITGWAPMVQSQPALGPLAFSMLSFAVRGFKAGRELEDTIDQTQMQLEQQMQQAQNAGPSPEEVQAQHEQQMQQAQQQHDASIEQMKQGHEAGLAQIQQAHDQQMEAAKQAGEQDKAQFEAAQEQHAAQIKQMNDEHAARLKAAVDSHKAELQAKVDTHAAVLKATTDRHKTEVDNLKNLHAHAMEIRKMDQAERQHQDKMRFEHRKHEAAREDAKLAREDAKAARHDATTKQANDEGRQTAQFDGLAKLINQPKEVNVSRGKDGRIDKATVRPTKTKDSE